MTTRKGSITAKRRSVSRKSTQKRNNKRRNEIFSQQSSHNKSNKVDKFTSNRISCRKPSQNETHYELSIDDYSSWEIEDY